LLHRDLEEYASDEALETMTARDEWRQVAALAVRPAAHVQDILRAKAEERWKLKVHFAKVRVEKLGWSAAAHHTALEIFGYRQNRAAMLAVAGRYPAESWVAGVEPRTVFAENATRWHLQGVRPANHPLTRLRQYRNWVSNRPDWQERIGRLAAGLPASVSATEPTKIARHSLGINRRRQVLALELMAGTLGGTRLDNLACDGLLPLLAARGAEDCFALWFHWFLGDVPEQVRRALPRLGVVDGRLHPQCHGYAQGLLGWFLANETHTSG
jgi:hypothetical protein